MPLPFIIAAGVAGSLGAGGHLMAKETNEEAKKISRKAQTIYDDAKISLEDAKNNMEESLLAFGYAKKNVLETSINQFLRAFERIKDDVKQGVNKKQDDKYMINEQDVLELRKMSDIYSSAISSTAAGVTAGALIGLATSGSLSLVTGGMSLAGALVTAGDIVGAATIAGSSLSLGLSLTPLAAFAAPVVLFTGISASVKADENLEKAKTMLAEAEAAVEKMKTSETMCNAIAKRSDMFRDLLIDLNEIFSQCAEKLDDITEKKVRNLNGTKIPTKDFSREELELIKVTLPLAGAVKAVIDVPLLSKEGTLTEQSQTVYKEVRDDYSEKVKEGVIQKQPKSSMIFCTGCGNGIMRDVKFCNYCGKKNTYTEEKR